MKNIDRDSPNPSTIAVEAIRPRFNGKQIVAVGLLAVSSVYCAGSAFIDTLKTKEFAETTDNTIYFDLEQEGLYGKFDPIANTFTVSKGDRISVIANALTPEGGHIDERRIRLLELNNIENGSVILNEGDKLSLDIYGDE